jgi:LPS sulfotransferase NodH
MAWDIIQRGRLTGKDLREPAWKDQFLPKHDLVGSAPTMRYAICSTPRSGSHFVGQIMKNTGVFGCPLEYFNPDNLPTWRQRARDEGCESIIQFLETKRTGANGRLGIKLHRTHLPAAIAEIGLEALQRDWKFILLRRKDILGQALSWSMAAQTDAWMSGLSAKKEAVYDRTSIMRYIKLASNHTASWQQFLAERGLVPLEVVYEDVAANPVAALVTISDFLSTPLPHDLDLARIVATKMQRTGSTEAWRERFIRETREEPKSASSFKYTGHRVGLIGRVVSRAKRAVVKSRRHVRSSSGDSQNGAVHARKA